MKYFSKNKVLGAKYNLSYGIWVIGTTALDIHTSYKTDFGTLKFKTFVGWTIQNFSGYKNIPAQDQIVFVDLIKATGRNYSFICPFERLLSKNKANHPVFKYFGLPKAYTE